MARLYVWKRTRENGQDEYLWYRTRGARKVMLEYDEDRIDYMKYGKRGVVVNDFPMPFELSLAVRTMKFFKEC